MLLDSVLSYDFTTDPRVIQKAPSVLEIMFADRYDAFLPARLAERYALLYQHRITDFYADFAHAGAKLVVELDGARYHRDAGPDKRHKDRMRENTLVNRGWMVKTFSYQDIEEDPAQCVMIVRNLIRVRLGDPYDGPPQWKYPIN